MSKKLLGGLVAVSLVLNLFLGFGLLKKGPSGDISEFIQKYPFLSRRISLDDQNDIIIHLTPLKMVLQEYLNEQKDTGELGLYFEYLPSGTSIGINDQMEVKVASLAKVPIVMAIYKKVESGQISLNDKLVIQNRDLDSNFGDLWKKGVGTTLTVQEAINLALINSDNTAHNLLTNHLTDYDVSDVLAELNIPIVESDKAYFLITPKNYTSIFRSLYLASYLSKDNSQQVLEILTRTAFSDKIRAGVPGDVIVAHKIGVFNLTTEGLIEEVYSDCGIIYAPDRPFALCVISRGYSEATAASHMKNLSSLIYSYITQVK